MCWNAVISGCIKCKSDMNVGIQADLMYEYRRYLPVVLHEANDVERWEWSRQSFKMIGLNENKITCQVIRIAVGKATSQVPLFSICFPVCMCLKHSRQHAIEDHYVNLGFKRNDQQTV